MSDPSADRLDRGTMLTLFAIGLAVFVIANDFTALSVALPDIEKDFDTDVATVQWVINAYALVFGVMIVTGGRLADMFGRRRIFFIGAAIFAGFSLLGGLAPDAWALIACRAAMGIGGAMMWPAVLGMTYAALPESKAGLAGGLILGAAGFGNAAGPLIGGALTDAFSWRAIMFLNLPVALFASLVVWRYVHQAAVEADERKIDYRGIAALSIGLTALLVALDQAPDYGWGDPRTVALLVIAGVTMAAFPFVERSAGASALVPRDVISNPEFRAACLAVLLMSATFFASLLYLPQFMEKILGYSAFESGAGLLPMMGVFAVTSFAAGPLYNRLGAKLVVSVGAAFLFAGMVLISLVDAGSEYVSLLPGMIVLGLGVGFFYSSVTTAGVTALDPSRSSLAGGVVYMFQIAGGAVGLGLTTTVFTTAAQDKLSAVASSSGLSLSGSEQDAVHGVLAGTDSAKQAISGLTPEAADKVVEAVRDSFAAGIEWAFRMDAALALCGLVVTVLFVGGSLLKSRSAQSKNET
ncbi:MAG: DHA2 family efflux MFS transporter permease subunit [Solirubrobacterales bacterium]